VVERGVDSQPVVNRCSDPPAPDDQGWLAKENPMNATSWFISIAALAWLGQILLGGWQVYQFNCAYDALHG